jgi:hypothetical protein
VSACGGSVEGALVYVTAVPYGQFGIPNEQATGSDGWATLQFTAKAGYPVSNRQQLLVMFVRARKSGENLLGGISTRRLVSVHVARAPGPLLDARAGSAYSPDTGSGATRPVRPGAGRTMCDRRRTGVSDTTTREDTMKGAQKPKKGAKKPAQKTLKERRAEKRATAKNSRPMDV